MMKQISSLLLGLLFLVLQPATGQNLHFEPADCSPGDRVNIQYNPTNTPLRGIESFDAVAYEITDDGLVATELTLEKADGVYIGAVQTSDKAKVLFIVLSTEDDKHKDNNNGKGYRVKMKTADKTAKVPGAYTGLAHAYGRYYRTLGIEKDFDMALKLVQKEFSKRPELKKEKAYLEAYAIYSNRAKNDEAKAEVKEIATSIQQRKNKTEDDWMLTHYLLNNAGEKEAAEGVAKNIGEKFPGGRMAKTNLISSFYKAKEVEDKVEVYNELQRKYGDDEKTQATLSNFASSIATSYGKNEDWTNFDKYFAMTTDPLQKASTLNSLAWDMSGEGIDGEAKQVDKAIELSRQSLELVNAAKTSGEGKPDSRTPKQWSKQLDYSYGMYADTYALLSYHKGNYDDAFKFQKIAGKSNKFKDGEMNERLCIYAEKAKGPEKAEKKLQWFIKEGVATSKMKEQYQRLFMTNNTLESAYSKHLAALESVANEKKREELKEKMLNEKAPDFQLVNLKGEQVSLKDMKGKVVVLDFWATWCGPCKASFPGMQKAVNKYADDDHVEFLFLDTWERGENKEENAAKFIEENGYTFHVLMDNDNKAVETYKVSGIPTKFVVDKNGQIRFKSIGFSGSDDGLVSELVMMIEMADEASTPTTASRP